VRLILSSRDGYLTRNLYRHFFLAQTVASVTVPGSVYGFIHCNASWSNTCPLWSTGVPVPYYHISMSNIFFPSDPLFTGSCVSVPRVDLRFHHGEYISELDLSLQPFIFNPTTAPTPSLLSKNTMSQSQTMLPPSAGLSLPTTAVVKKSSATTLPCL